MAEAPGTRARRGAEGRDEPRGPPEVSFRGAEGVGEAEGCPAGALLPVSWLRCSVSPARRSGSSPGSRWTLPLQGSEMTPVPDPVWVVAASSAPSTVSWRRAAAEVSSIPPIPPGLSPIRALCACGPLSAAFHYPLGGCQNSFPTLEGLSGVHGQWPGRGRSRGCGKLGSARGAPQQQQGLAGTHGAEPGIDFPLIPCNHILQRLLSYISIPHLRL